MELFEEQSRGPRASAIVARTGFDEDTVQRALHALYTEPFFHESLEAGGGHIVFVGTPTGDALRVAGQWPTPENQLERVIAAIEAAADDESRQAEERSRFKQIAPSLRGAAYQVAITALGGAGGNLLSS